jgi:hypothetical protein
MPSIRCHQSAPIGQDWHLGDLEGPFEKAVELVDLRLKPHAALHWLFGEIGGRIDPAGW